MERIRGIAIKTLTILAGFWLADLAAARIQAGIAAGESMERIMDGMTTMLQHPNALGFDRTSLLCGLGGACAVGLFHLYRWSISQRNWREGEEYGSARWSTSREMAPYTDGDTRQNLQMTATEGLSLDAQATRRNLNTTVIGGSGSGKTATHVIPNILKGSMNYACTDPKGELYAKTGGDLEKMGYTVKQLDLVDLTSETKFNPMRYIDPDKPDVAIMRLVTNIMDNTNGSTPKEHQTDDFWTKSERSLLTALTAFVYYLPDDILKDCLRIDAGQTLNAVADMRDLLEASEQDETKESQVDAVARTATEIYEETRAEWERAGADHDDPDLREAWRLAQGLKFAARQYRPFTQGARETKKGIIQREDGHLPRPARRGPDLQLFGRDLLPMPVRQHHPPLPYLPRRMPRHAIALLPRRVRQRGTHPQLRQAHRHDPLAQGQRQHHPPDHRPAEDHVQGLVGDHRRQLRQRALPRRQRAVHHRMAQQAARQGDHRPTHHQRLEGRVRQPHHQLPAHRPRTPHARRARAIGQRQMHLQPARTAPVPPPQGMARNHHRQTEIHAQALQRMEGSGMKPNSYTFMRSRTPELTSSDHCRIGNMTC